MRPDGPTILTEFRSRDPERIRAAGRALEMLDDPGSLAWLAPYRDELRNIADGTKLGGALMDGIIHVQFAIKRLDALQPGGRCACARYASYSFANPVVQAKRGRIDILHQQIFRERYFTRWRCACTNCGLQWAVQDEQGWHVATYDWTPLRGSAAGD